MSVIVEFPHVMSQCLPSFLLLWDAAVKGLRPCVFLYVKICRRVSTCAWMYTCMCPWPWGEEMVLVWRQPLPDRIFQMMWSPSFIKCVYTCVCARCRVEPSSEESVETEQGGEHGNMASCRNENRKLEPNEHWNEISAIQKETMMKIVVIWLLFLMMVKITVIWLS